MLEQQNPGTMIKLKVDNENKFEIFFMAFGACIFDFREYCRPVIAIDNNCGVFCLSFLNSIIRGLSISSITQLIVDKLKKDYALEIFLNNTDPTVDILESE